MMKSTRLQQHSLDVQFDTYSNNFVYYRFDETLSNQTLYRDLIK